MSVADKPSFAITCFADVALVFCKISPSRFPPVTVSPAGEAEGDGSIIGDGVGESEGEGLISGEGEDAGEAVGSVVGEGSTEGDGLVRGADVGDGVGDDVGADEG